MTARPRRGQQGDPLPQPAGHALFDLMISESLEPGRDNRQLSWPVTTIDVNVKMNVIAVGRPRVCLHDGRGHLVSRSGWDEQ